MYECLKCERKDRRTYEFGKQGKYKRDGYYDKEVKCKRLAGNIFGFYKSHFLRFKKLYNIIPHR